MVALAVLLPTRPGAAEARSVARRAWALLALDRALSEQAWADVKPMGLRTWTTGDRCLVASEPTDDARVPDEAVVRCSCPIGRSGWPCIHQAAVAVHLLVRFYAGAGLAYDPGATDAQGQPLTARVLGPAVAGFWPALGALREEC